MSRPCGACLTAESRQTARAWDMGYAIRTRHYAAAPDTPSQENPLRRRGGHDYAADKGHAAMWPGAATILVLLTVSASGARAQSSAPDASTIPGAVNPAVTQKTIGETICIPGWTRIVRPAVGYTEELKRQQMAAFGYHDRRLSHYEEDHLIPLGLGGAPSDPRNLWPEPRTPPDGWGADRKDELEFVLNQLVCSGGLPLPEAQRAIATKWIAAYLR